MIKKIYKKTLGIVLAAAMMLSIAGCGSKEKEAKIDSTTAIEVSDNTQNVEATQAATEAVVTTAYAQTENEEFEKYIMDAFTEDIMSSTSSYHQNVKDLSSFGIERPTEAYWMKEIPTGTAEEIIAAEQKKVEEPKHVEKESVKDSFIIADDENINWIDNEEHTSVVLTDKWIYIKPSGMEIQAVKLDRINAYQLGADGLTLYADGFEFGISILSNRNKQSELIKLIKPIIG